ncbi:hypothetical protein ACQP3J_31260, partial [Escherichia coli]
LLQHYKHFCHGLPADILTLLFGLISKNFGNLGRGIHDLVTLILDTPAKSPMYKQQQVSIGFKSN